VKHYTLHLKNQDKKNKTYSEACPNLDLSKGNPLGLIYCSVTGPSL
jgi:hypothetical protein